MSTSLHISTVFELVPFAGEKLGFLGEAKGNGFLSGGVLSDKAEKRALDRMEGE